MTQLLIKWLLLLLLVTQLDSSSTCTCTYLIWSRFAVVVGVVVKEWTGNWSKRSENRQKTSIYLNCNHGALFTGAPILHTVSAAFLEVFSSCGSCWDRSWIRNCWPPQLFFLILVVTSLSPHHHVLLPLSSWLIANSSTTFFTGKQVIKSRLRDWIKLTDCRF